MATASRLRATLDVVTTIAMVTASGVLIWVVLAGPRQAPAPTSSRKEALPGTPISVEGAAHLGRPNAKVALIEYSDFQCPYCGKAAREALPIIVDKFIKPGTVQMVFRHLPLENVHPFARRAAEAAECARRQGRFWQMHDSLFGPGAALEESQLHLYGQSIGLDRTAFTRCLDGGEARLQVKRDVEEARSLRITGTPTFLFGLLQQDGRIKVVRRASGSTADVLARTLDELVAQVAKVSGS